MWMSSYQSSLSSGYVSGANESIREARMPAATVASMFPTECSHLGVDDFLPRLADGSQNALHEYKKIDYGGSEGNELCSSSPSSSLPRSKRPDQCIIGEKIEYN